MRFLNGLHQARCIVMESASPSVSPNVVAAALMNQKARVSSGTLLEPIS